MWKNEVLRLQNVYKTAKYINQTLTQNMTPRIINMGGDKQ
jgi:hypothetical protein